MPYIRVLVCLSVVVLCNAGLTLMLLWPSHISLEETDDTNYTDDTDDTDGTDDTVDTD